MKTKASSNKGLRLLLVTLLLLIVSFTLLLRSTYSASAPGKEVSFSELTRIAANGQITEATLLDEDARLIGTRCVPTSGARSAAPAPGAVACNGRTEKFHADYPRSDVSTLSLIDNITRGGAKLTIDKQDGKAIAKLLITFIFPLAMLANLFGLIFLSRGGDSSLADIAGFGKLGRKQKRKAAPTTSVTFADVAGVDDAIVELQEVIEYLTEPAKFEAYSAAAPKGVLLFGSPGCGKTLLARAIAGESGVPFFSVSGTEFVESLVGVGAARVRDLFAQVREVAPAIVFIDEIDAVGRRREGEGMSGGEREQTLNQLLVEMDGFDVTAGIVLVGATNRPDILDPALMRPGRFDRHITLTPPDIHGRKAILEVHARNKPFAPDVDFDGLAKRTPGFTGADLANVINEAALMTIRANRGGQVENSHVSEAVQRVLHGPHRGNLMSAEERERIAYHESGHAMVAAAFGKGASLNRVSIVGRGRGLGQSTVSEDNDRVLLTAEEIEIQLAISMGGVAAEQLQYGKTSTTAEDDIEKATGLAKEMVGLYGMSPEIGRVRMLNKYSGYLGGSVSLEAISEQTMQAFDEEVKRLIGTAEQRASIVLRDARDHLNKMAQVLLTDETLEDTALQSLLAPVKTRADVLRNGTGTSPGTAAKARPRTTV
ncbi:MAG TPA: ATP-dependent zinc metalloprotease FtsH [Acidimicrobiales bacterium]|nr:ATP-dependent zinc metalloprotease FtsH [Acidimicrobiales bacterium]